MVEYCECGLKFDTLEEAAMHVAREYVMGQAKGVSWDEKKKKWNVDHGLKNNDTKKMQPEEEEDVEDEDDDDDVEEEESNE